MLRCSIVPLPQKSEPDLDEVRTRSEIVPSGDDGGPGAGGDDDDRTLRPSAAVAAYTVKSDLPPRDDADPYDAITVVAPSPSIPPIDALPEELYALAAADDATPHVAPANVEAGHVEAGQLDSAPRGRAPARLPAEDEPDSVTLRPWQSVFPPKT